MIKKKKGSHVKNGLRKIPGKGTVCVKARGEKYLNTLEEMKDGYCGWCVQKGESDPR